MDVEKFEIPEITEEKLLKMYETIKPLVYDPDKGKMRYISLDVDELRNTAFTWSPIFLSSPTIDIAKLKSFKTVRFLTSSYPMLWKPSVEEVFAFVQSDEEILKDAVAFSVEYIAIHESGEGSIGFATFYKYKNTKDRILSKTIDGKFFKLNKLEDPKEKCPVCNTVE